MIHLSNKIRKSSLWSVANFMTACMAFMHAPALLSKEPLKNSSRRHWHSERLTFVSRAQECLVLFIPEYSESTYYRQQ